MKRSRRHFVRLFTSILAIAVALILLEIAVVSISAYRATRRWPAFVAGEYIAAVERSIKAASSVSPDAMITSIIAASNDSVSGVIIRDEEGRPSIFYGDLFEGSGKQTLLYDNNGELDYSDEISAQTAEKDDNVEVKVATYAFHMDTNEDLSYSFSVESTGVKKLSLELPPNIKKADVAASVDIYSGDEFRGSFDIIAFGVSSYPPTQFIMKGFLLVTLLILPISMIIAVLASWRVSRKSSRSIIEINNALASLAASNYDISLTKQKTEEYDAIASSIMHLSDELKRNQAARREWLRSISHDLNTPISGLQMLLDGAMDGVFPLDEKLLSQMKGELDSLSSRIASVSYYSKLLSPESSAVKVPQSASELAKSVIAKTGQVERFVLEDKGGTVNADMLMADRALFELCDNALKYSFDIIKVIAEQDRITVISHSALPLGHPDFFEPWARGDISRHEGGSGMGLPIAGAIMSLHKGRVILDEKDGYVRAVLDFKEKQTS